MIRLSIIIPVYNVDKYLENCIDSILKQKLHDYEIILVDDGSTDDSGLICDKYSKKNEFVKVIHKENGGLSDARNAGIKRAIGEYLMFVDSDDYINEEENLNEIYKYLEYDIIQYKMLYYYEKSKKKKLLKDLTLNNSKNVLDVLREKVKNGELSISACDKIVRRDLIIKNNLFFEKGLLSEDIDWSLRLYLLINSIYTINLNLYVYRQDREGSITNTGNNKSIVSLYNIIKRWKKYSYPSEEIKNIFLNYLAYQYAILITIVNKNNCSKKIKKEIYSMKDILKYSENYKVKKCNLVINYLGFEIGIYILKLYLKLKNKGLIKL